MHVNPGGVQVRSALCRGLTTLEGSKPAQRRPLPRSQIGTGHYGSGAVDGTGVHVVCVVGGIGPRL
jgi:hypothetical protein